MVVHATGDVNLDPRQLGLARTSFDGPWDGVRDLFGADDLSITNLECAPIEGGEAQDKEFTFRCPQGLAEMRAAGVDVANLGNNHSGDYGPGGWTDGRARVAAAGLRPVGAGRDATEANAPAIVELGGTRIAVLGFGGVVPVPSWIAGADHPGVADGYSVEAMTSAVRAAAEQADVVLVTVHWGDEGDTEPNADDVARAHAMIDAGADAIFGHHAHVLQPLRWHAGKPIFYGLGNFVWPGGGPTGIARVELGPDGEIVACLLPATISGGRPTLDGPASCEAGETPQAQPGQGSQPRSWNRRQATLVW